MAAVGVALFPTSAPDGITSLAWVKPWVVKVHFASAIVLFVMFAVFSLWLFRKTTKTDKKPDSDKQKRNVIYLFCGLIIIGCIGWGVYKRLRGESIFWPESVALASFSVSWLIKGYAHSPLVNVARLFFRWLRS